MKVFKRFILLAGVLAVAGLTSAVSTVRTNRDGKKMYRFIIQIQSQVPSQMLDNLRWLKNNEYDIAGYVWDRGQIEVITDDAGLQKLKAKNIKGFIKGQKQVGVEVSGIDSRYLTSQKVEQKLRQLAAQYNQLTRIEQIGTSLQGRPILAMLISTTPNPQDPKYLEKPSIIFDGMHHAREIMTSEIVMDVAESILTAKAQKASPKVTAMLDQWNIWVVPMLNVDGNNIVWTQDSYWRKNARAESGSAFGVDLNRNYSYRWSNCGGSSNSKGAQDYHGASASSEPETKALSSLGQMVRPVASLSYHSYSELVLFPYSCEGAVTGENELVAGVATMMAKALPSDSGSGNYRAGTPWQLLYPVDGDSMSYMFSEFGSLALTMEVNQEFQPDYSLREPTLIKHRAAWAKFLQFSTANLLKLTVLDARTGKSVAAQIKIATIQQKQGEKPFQTNAAGNFFKVLKTGAYNVQAVTADGRTANISVEMSGTPKVVQLQIP